MTTNKVFEIIQFTGQKERYYGDTITMSDMVLQSGKHIKLSRKEIPLGHSRYGGPVVDLPPGIGYPDDHLFAAQLDLSLFSPFDKSGLLPKAGQLIFFANLRENTVKVIYANIKNDELVKVTKEHEKMFFEGVLVDKVFASTESIEDRYREPEDEDEKEYANASGKIWDDYAESKKSKIFGIYTHCQWEEDEIMEIINSEKLILLQVGVGDFNDEGVFSVLIDKEDLKNKNFDNCTFSWAQT